MSNIKPSCPLGYTLDDLQKLDINLNEFFQWMNGKTIGVCTGQEFDYKIQQYIPSKCVSYPHNEIYYESDINRFLNLKKKVK